MFLNKDTKGCGDQMVSVRKRKLKQRGRGTDEGTDRGTDEGTERGIRKGTGSGPGRDIFIQCPLPLPF